MKQYDFPIRTVTTTFHHCAICNRSYDNEEEAKSCFSRCHFALSALEGPGKEIKVFKLVPKAIKWARSGNVKILMDLGMGDAAERLCYSYLESKGSNTLVHIPLKMIVDLMLTSCKIS